MSVRLCEHLLTRILSQQSLAEVIGRHEHQVGQQEVIQQHFYDTHTQNTSLVTSKAIAGKIVYNLFVKSHRNSQQSVF